MILTVVICILLLYLAYSTNWFIRRPKVYPDWNEGLQINHTAYPLDIHSEIDPNIAHYEQKSRQKDFQNGMEILENVADFMDRRKV